MTRSYKYTDRDHAGLADGTAVPEEHLPRFFAKSGYIDQDPKKVKKEGGGKGNWGHPGEEVVDSGYNMSAHRRRSNSSTHGPLNDFKTKFETVEADPVFEEETMGPLLEKEDTLDSQSTSTSSLEEEEGGDTQHVPANHK